MRCKDSKIKKHWLVAFYLFFGWCILAQTSCFIQAIVSFAEGNFTPGDIWRFFGLIVGVLSLIGASYEYAYEQRGLKVLTSLLLIIGMKTFYAAIHFTSHMPYNVITVGIGIYFWYFCYQLFKANVLYQNQLKMRKNGA